MRNLIAEMARYGVSIVDVQKELGCTEKTVRNKINGETEFTLSEAFSIWNAFFRGLTLEYLFQIDNQKSA